MSEVYSLPLQKPFITTQNPFDNPVASQQVSFIFFPFLPSNFTNKGFSQIILFHFYTPLHHHHCCNNDLLPPLSPSLSRSSQGSFPTTGPCMLHHRHLFILDTAMNSDLLTRTVFCCCSYVPVNWPNHTTELLCMLQDEQLFCIQISQVCLLPSRHCPLPVFCCVSSLKHYCFSFCIFMSLENSKLFYSQAHVYHSSPQVQFSNHLPRRYEARRVLMVSHGILNPRSYSGEVFCVSRPAPRNCPQT